MYINLAFSSTEAAVLWLAERVNTPIPTPDSNSRADRDDTIRRRYHDGERIASIARDYGLTWTRVQQIVKAVAPV